MKSLAPILLLIATQAGAANLADARARMDADFKAGRPLVAHVVVALVDNQHQGIVPVPAALGDGSKPSANLYWGAMYGVRTFFRRSAAWQSLPVSPSGDARVLDRVAFRREVNRGGRQGEAIVVAEAWRGDSIQDAIRHYLEMSQGQHAQAVKFGEREAFAGGEAHVLVFVGHNGLMDFEAPSLGQVGRRPSARAAIVLACMSDQYFSPLLADETAPLLMTTGLMAPEAYSLDAALSSWFAGDDEVLVRRAAALAYARFQRISDRAALRLFRTPGRAAP